MVALAGLAAERDLSEFVRDPVVTIASVLLVVVAIAWVIVSRHILNVLRQAAFRRERAPGLEWLRRSSDMWKYPPMIG